MGLPRLFALEDEYVTTLLEAELDFIRRLVEDIESGHLDGLEGWHGFFPDESERGGESDTTRLSVQAAKIDPASKKK
jgi:hypothetical protein